MNGVSDGLMGGVNGFKSLTCHFLPLGFVHSEDWHPAKDDLWFIHNND